MTRTPRARRWLRLGAGACFAVAGFGWWTVGSASAAGNDTSGPTKTAWYDRTGAQNVTGETTPSAARADELEVSYVPAQATAPQQTIPPTVTSPTVPGAPVQPPGPPEGNVGGNSLGYALAFAAVDYEIPLEQDGQTLDPSSLAGTLTLALDQTSSSNVSTGDLLACPTVTTLWSAGGDQDASQAPQYSCSDAVTGNVDSSAHTVSFALSSSQENGLSAGAFSLVIVPSTAPAGPFQAVFSAPGATSFVLTDASAMGNPNTDLVGSGSSDLSGTGDLSAGSIEPQAFTPSSAGPSPSAPGSPGGASVPVGGYHELPAVLRGGLGASAQRTVALVVLLGLGTLLVLASSQQVRAPRSLRALGDGGPEGVGPADGPAGRGR